MDLHPALPDFQLQFGQSCILPFVKSSKFGLLGLEENYVLLTDSTCNGRAVHKAMIIGPSDGMRSSHGISGFKVAHFDASQCGLFQSGHLEQIAMACPNLQHLNLQGNMDCLRML